MGFGLLATRDHEQFAWADILGALNARLELVKSRLDNYIDELSS